MHSMTGECAVWGGNLCKCCSSGSVSVSAGVVCSVVLGLLGLDVADW